MKEALFNVRNLVVATAPVASPLWFYSQWLFKRILFVYYDQCDQKKLPKNDFTGKMIDFAIFTKFAWKCGSFGELIVAKWFKSGPKSNKSPNLVTLTCSLRQISFSHRSLFFPLKNHLKIWHFKFKYKGNEWISWRKLLLHNLTV